jgi:hypothetical protein
MKKVKGFKNYYGDFISYRGWYFMKSSAIISILTMLVAIVLSVTQEDLTVYAYPFAYIWTISLLLGIVGSIFLIKDGKTHSK